MLVGQTDVGFVNQSGGLQRIGTRLTAEITGGQFAELVRDERNQLIKRSFVAAAPLYQQLSNALIWAFYRLLHPGHARRSDEPPQEGGPSSGPVWCIPTKNHYCTKVNIAARGGQQVNVLS